MSNQERDNQDEKKKTDDSVLKPDAKTLHTTDPQKKMEGPISSLMHDAGKKFDTNETKEEADKEKEDNL